MDFSPASLLPDAGRPRIIKHAPLTCIFDAPIQAWQRCRRVPVDTDRRVGVKSCSQGAQCFAWVAPSQLWKLGAAPNPHQWRTGRRLADQRSARKAQTGNRETSWAGIRDRCQISS
jgi:hypothetical protein